MGEWAAVGVVCGAGRAAAIGRGAGVCWVLLDGRNESSRAVAASNNDERAGRDGYLSLDVGRSARHCLCLGAKGAGCGTEEAEAEARGAEWERRSWGVRRAREGQRERA